MLRAECDQGGVQWRMPCSVEDIAQAEVTDGQGFRLSLSEEGRPSTLTVSSLVIATGGLPIPQIGATDYGLKIARQFGLKIVEPRPALVPLTFDGNAWADFVPLAGVALEAGVATGEGRTKQSFLEDVLFTHRGLSGPGILQISSYWQPGQPITLDLAPGQNMSQTLLEAKSGSKQQVGTLLGSLWPKRLAERWLGEDASKRLADLPDRYLVELGKRIHAWSIVPNGTEAIKKLRLCVVESILAGWISAVWRQKQCLDCILLVRPLM